MIIMCYVDRRGFGPTVRRNSFSRKERQKWVTKGKKTRAKGNNGKRPSLIRRKSEKRKKKRRTDKCPALSGDLRSSKEVLCQFKGCVGTSETRLGGPDTAQRPARVGVPLIGLFFL
jgi:hypothetical protein